MLDEGMTIKINAGEKKSDDNVSKVKNYIIIGCK